MVYLVGASPNSCLTQQWCVTGSNLTLTTRENMKAPPKAPLATEKVRYGQQPNPDYEGKHEGPPNAPYWGGTFKMVQ
ncbi:MAG: hypothetical protein F6K55_48090 [Moorea sp. SIO4A3]|nr:hypothetical protein [Moorena sp. SIO4A3]